MAKKLVNEQGVDALVEDGKFYMDGTVILTPGAKDVLRNKGVNIVYGSRPETVETDIENGDQVAENLAALLVKASGITDDEKVMAVCCKLIKMIMK